jgi:hypothetical protein
MSVNESFWFVCTMVISLEPSKSRRWNGLSFFFRAQAPRLVLALLRNRRKSKVTSMKSDEIRTIFSVYQIWLAGEKERIAADLREVCEAGQTARGMPSVSRSFTEHSRGERDTPSEPGLSLLKSDQQEREGRPPARARRLKLGFLPTPPSPP